MASNILISCLIFVTGRAVAQEFFGVGDYDLQWDNSGNYRDFNCLFEVDTWKESRCQKFYEQDPAAVQTTCNKKSYGLNCCQFCKSKGITPRFVCKDQNKYCDNYKALTKTPGRYWFLTYYCYKTTFCGQKGPLLKEVHGSQSEASTSQASTTTAKKLTTTVPTTPAPKTTTTALAKVPKMSVQYRPEVRPSPKFVLPLIPQRPSHVREPIGLPNVKIETITQPPLVPVSVYTSEVPVVFETTTGFKPKPGKNESYWEYRRRIVTQFMPGPWFPIQYRGGR